MSLNRSRADGVLIFVAMLWGATFVAQKAAMPHVGPIFFVAMRFVAATLFLAPLAFYEVRRHAVRLRGRDLAGALAIGACLCSASWLQQIALTSTSATNAGFLTAIYMVLVPFVAWIVARHRPRPVVIAASFVALAGAWLLAGGGAPRGGWSVGDLLVLLSDVIWAIHISLIARFSAARTHPMFVSFVQCGLTCLVSVPAAFVLQPATMDQFFSALAAIAWAGIVSSGIAFTLQIIAQRHTPPAEAALIMSLESVFSAISAAILLHETLTLRAAVGAFLIMLGVVLVEAGPLLARTRLVRAAGGAAT